MPFPATTRHLDAPRPRPTFRSVQSPGLFAASGALSAFALMGPAPAFAQAAGPEIRNSGVMMRLSVDKTDIVVGEPVHLRFVVSNESCTYPKGNFGGRLHLSEGNDIEVSVQAPGELPQRYIAGEDNQVYASVEIDLSKGESMATMIPLLQAPARPTGYLFDRPGEYTLRASVAATVLRENTKTDVPLGPVKVTVREPAGNDAADWKTLATPAVAKALHLGSGDDPAAVERARSVALAHPDGPYGPLCRLLSGVAAMKASPPDYAAGRAALTGFVTGSAGHPRAAEAAFSMVSLETRANRPDAARDWLYFMRDAYPDYPLLRRENRMASEYYFKALDASPADRPWWFQQRPWDTTAKPDANQ